MENHTIVTLKKGEGRTIKAGGAWIFDNEIDTITGTFTNGDIVVVHDFDGYPMGCCSLRACAISPQKVSRVLWQKHQPCVSIRRAAGVLFFSVFIRLQGCFHLKTVDEFMKNR